ncbi:MAG: ATP-binding protein [Candidatus Omnitrophota bacterium]|nr:PAS domain-containing protein [Candidatus Omnitrophota bacterium]
MPMRLAIHNARKTKRIVTRTAKNILCNGRKISVMVTVIPIKAALLKEKFFLVLFDEITQAVKRKNLSGARKGRPLEEKSVEVEKDGCIKDLEKELVETKEYLQTVIEEQGNVNEELKNANEEILSSNEELQSTNEELETAKEELQSSNEELTTTNEELHNRNAEVSLLNNDLINLFSSINIPVVMMGIDLVIRRVTPQADKVLNITASDVGRSISKVKLNIDIPDFEKTLSDVIESLHPKIFEIKDKEGNWYSVYVRPYRTMDNKIDGAVALFVDVTERKHSEQLVEEACTYAESIIETMREPLIVLGDDLKVISANRSFYRIFKVNPEKTKGCFIYDLGNGQWDIPKLRQLLEDILPKQIVFNDYEIEHNFESIGPKTMLLNARRLANRHMILITMEDITERKKAEEASAVAAKAKSAFNSMVSHELRTPLSALKESVSQVSEGLLGTVNEDQKKFLEIAKRNVDRLARLINDILDFQTFESGKMVFKMENNDINEVVKETKEIMNLVAKEKGLNFILNLDERLPKIKFDRDKINQVIVNLVSNSLKLTEKGSITISTTQENNVIQVSVKDTGPGIQEEDMSRLFRHYEQLERKTGGTGLGLAISLEIIKAHDGKIWAESTFGQGATMHFILPIEERRRRT